MQKIEPVENWICGYNEHEWVTYNDLKIAI